MTVPTEFSLNYIREHFLEDIILSRKSLHASLERVELTVRS